MYQQVQSPRAIRIAACTAYSALSAQMETDFKCKDDEWLTVDEDLDYLGMQIRQDSQYLYIFMEKYIHKYLCAAARMVHEWSTPS